MPPSAREPADAALRDLCRRLFQSPRIITHTVSHQITQPFHFARHAHDNLLQFDLLIGCAGRAWCDGRWVALQGHSALVAYPRQEHGYDLEPGGGAARVYHLQLEVDPSWPAVAERVFPAGSTNVAGAESLASAMRVVVRLGVIDAVRPPLLLARLAEALALWPGVGAEGRATEDSPEDTERGLEAAVDLIERRLADPPSAEELAATAHFSVRHFTRRFRAAYGCTPHDYLTARRFALGRQLLSQERLSVTHVAEQLGFGSVATFSRWFTQQAGLSPTAFRENPSLM